ncbi:MAG: O-antigen ligase family protein [Thermodesulfobacteriota bacterium]
MIDMLSAFLSLHTLVVALSIGAIMLVSAVVSPAFVLALQFPAWTFLILVKDYYPVSTSAVSSVFPIISIAGAALCRRRFTLDAVHCLLMLYMGLLIVSLRHSPNPEYGLEKITLTCFQSVPIVVAASYALGSFQQINRVIAVLNWTLGFYVGASALLLFTGTAAIGAEGRYSALHDVTVSGQLLGLGIVSALYWWKRRNLWIRVLAYTLVVAAGLLLLKTGTRTPIASAVVTIVVMQFVRSGKPLISFLMTPRTLVAALLIIPAAIIGSVCLPLVVSPESYDKRFSGVSAFFYVDDLNDPKYRYLNYATAVALGMENPLFGLGVGGYKDAFIEETGVGAHIRYERHPVYPHNLFLEAFSEHGVPGLVIFALLTFVLSRRWLTLARCLPNAEIDQQRIIEAVLSLFLYGFLLSQTSLDIPRMITLWWAVGLLLAASKTWKLCETSATANTQARKKRSSEQSERVSAVSRENLCTSLESRCRWLP